MFPAGARNRAIPRPSASGTAPAAFAVWFGACFGVFFAVFFAVGFAWCGTAIAQQPPAAKPDAFPEWTGRLSQITEIHGFDAPAGASWDSTARVWYVSNIGGLPAVRDGKGWISRFSADGKTVTMQWVQHLNAPKGLDLRGRTLYVADLDEVAEIDADQGIILRRVRIPGAGFLTGLAAAPNGDVYVSEPQTSTVYRIPLGAEPEVFLRSADLAGPTGLVFDGTRLLVASWGPVMDPRMMNTSAPGRVLSIDLATKKIRPFEDCPPLGKLKGLTRGAGGVFVSEFDSGRLYLLLGKAGIFRAGGIFETPADLRIGDADSVLAVPSRGPGVLHLIALRRAG